MNRREYLERVCKEFPPARKQFELDVKAASSEAIKLSRSFSNAIGEVSVLEAKNAIIREFSAKLLNR